MPSSTPAYLSSLSANALISDLRPTTLSPASLTHLNLLLDELLVSLISASQSINPNDLRREGISAVFSTGTGPGAGESTGVRALGRSAVAEAEVELRSWQDGRAKGSRGFPPDGKGPGTVGDRAFPLSQAVDLLRVKCVALSTLAPQDAEEEKKEEELMAAWKRAGGDISEETVEPAGLWITAIIEHVCEHVLSQLARVIARDSGITIAEPQHLYTALCEDETIWGLFKRMKVKDELENVIRTASRSKRSTPSRASPDLRIGGRASSPVISGSPHDSKTSLVHHDGSIKTSRGVTSSPPIGFENARTSIETTRSGGIAGGIVRKPSNLSKKISPAKNLLHSYTHSSTQNHERNESVISVNTRSILGASNDTYDGEDGEEGQSPQDAQDEFDALVKSGETMRVSLTPSRLRNFDAAGGRKRQNDSPVDRLAGRSRAGSTRSDRPQSNAIVRANPVPALPDAAEFLARSTPPRSVTSSPSNGSPDVNSVDDRARSEFAQRKLLARPAATIDEKRDEDDPFAMKNKGNKQSLLELLAEDEAFGASPSESSGSPARSPQAPLRRTVPAVVLGTPPPPPPTKRVPSPLKVPSAGSSPNIDRPIRSREHSAQGEDSAIATANRKKTEAQELADFFNSTEPPGLPPPPPSTLQEDDFEQPPLTGKSGKGFKSFVMARVKGSSKSKSTNPNTPLSSSSSHTRLNSLNAILPRSGSSQHVKQAPVIDDIDIMESTRDKQRLKKPRSKATAPSDTKSSTTSGSKREVSPAPPIHEAAAKGDNYSRTDEDGEGKGLALEQARIVPPTQEVEVQDESNFNARLPPAIPSGEGSEIIPPPPATSTPPRKLSTPEETLERPRIVSATSEAASFMTANEGDISDVEEPSETQGAGSVDRSSSDLETRTVRGAEVFNGKTSSPVEGNSTNLDSHPSSVAPPVANDEKTAEPSILLRDLVPLRHLLDHATTARECQLLLCAILTQYGVPPSPSRSDSEQDRPSPEDRVMAWLLAGREGPVGDTARAGHELNGNLLEEGRSSGKGTGRDGGVITPTQAPRTSSYTSTTTTKADQIDSANNTVSPHTPPPRSAQLQPDEEDLLSESDLTSREGEDTDNEEGVIVGGNGNNGAVRRGGPSPVRIVRREGMVV
ncbi:hypothetical protein CI109_100291 [Kwoniella shandongensis]|uniref:Uncharacterized protein n=1 Tax=Kwoniella shandongensis TaxID=1734106 RepID=A0A5M6C4A6_9TREE|nr:uncharacterized protein CI109_001864 [Kwoniella shandongensis]KAA5529924.1 hypothetical protein CI109_001864 [Kwoniella shandongensis]